MYILGDSFLRSYYSIYDYEDQKVGLAKNIYSNGTIYEKNDLPGWVIFIIVASCFIIIGSLLFWYKKRHDKKKR